MPIKLLNEEQPKRLGGRKNSSLSLHDRIAQFYYSHGLFCTSYPTTVVTVAIVVALLCCYPLLNLPLMASSSVMKNNGTLKQNPKYYVQQVVLKAAVIPWNENLAIGDAFRAPLYESFKLLDIVRNFQDPINLKTLGHVCLHVESIRKTRNDLQADVLPEYSCLVLSPANMWKQDVQQFTQDLSILNTIYHYQNLQKGKTSIAEMLFGMHLVDSGIKRYPLRNRQRVLQYAVTIFLTEYDTQFILGLRKKLQTLYPLHQPENITEQDLLNTVIIHYPGEMKYLEYVPLLFTYLLLFVYYYFSVRKIEIINSKFGMACTIVLTTISSLLMTLGICFFFGLTLSVHNRKIFPYMVMLLGLENVLVLTKSVVSTPSHLDIKIRVAQGLSKEGWSITKNLCLEITILTIGLFTFVPAIQEICIFSIVGLMADFFLQMLFFSTILGLDIRQLEKTDKTKMHFGNSFYQTFEKSTLSRSKSHPRLNSLPANIVASQTQGKQEKRIPKRLRLVNIWARTRFFQRSFMILMCVWIAMILYNSGIVEQYFTEFHHHHHQQQTPNKSAEEDGNKVNYNILPILNSNENYLVNYVTEKANVNLQKHQGEFNKLKHNEDYAPWLNLNTQHWISILRKYNISLSGEYLAVLPNIKISHAVTPEEAVLLRNSEEKYPGQSFQWQALALALDPIDFSDIDGLPVVKTQNLPQSDRPFYPTSPMELFLTAILCAISVLVVAYTVFVLYRCICSRNYAEWRASWSADKSDNENEVPVLLEAVPILLEGHKQEIECTATDGTSIASSCLGGNVKIWDATTGELVANIDRHEPSTDTEPKRYEDHYQRTPTYTKHNDEETISFLRKKINLKFENLRLDNQKCQNRTRREFDFGDEYKQILRNRKTDHPSLHNGTEEPAELVRPTAIWCIDFIDNLVVIGCADGRLEFWEGTTAKFKGVCEDANGSGVTTVKIVGSKVVAARLYGSLDFYQLQTYNQGKPIDWNFTCAYRRTHVRTGSAGSISEFVSKENGSGKEDLRCVKLLSAKAHQQPITCLDCEGGRVLTGSQDHTLKVFRLEDGSHLYTLHGHFGPISCLFIDRINPATSGSGSQDGMLCVWDLLTGACMYSIQAHDGPVTSLTYSASYVISLGSDERVCVWERFQGHLLNTFSVHASFSSHIAMLTPHLAVTARSGGLVLWDVRSGDSVKSIVFGHSPYVFVKQLIVLRDAVVCDYGAQLRIVRFPVVLCVNANDPWTGGARN